METVTLRVSAANVPHLRRYLIGRLADEGGCLEREERNGEIGRASEEFLYAVGRMRQLLGALDALGWRDVFEQHDVELEVAPDFLRALCEWGEEDLRKSLHDLDLHRGSYREPERVEWEDRGRLAAVREVAGQLEEAR